MKKAKYKRYDYKKTGKPCLDINMKGFLCSCNNREKDCISEAYNILNKFLDMQENKQEMLDQNTQTETDVQDDLTNEIANLKSESKWKTFQVVESGAKNFLFIKTSINNPVELATSIMLNIKSTKKQQTKFLIRLIPIEVTCKAYIKDIEIAFKPLADKYFMQEGKTFSVAYNHRNNNNLIREEVIKCIANIINKCRSDNKVDLKSAQVVVIVEVIKGIALLSVVPDYIEYKKFNLLALSESDLPCATEINESDDKTKEENIN